MNLTPQNDPFRYYFKKVFTESLYLPFVALISCFASSFFGKPKPWQVTVLSCGFVFFVIILMLVLSASICGLIALHHNRKKK